MRSLFTDETGSWSSARVLLFVQFAYVSIAALAGDPGPRWWAYQGTLTVGLVSWAAGPRGLQHVGSQLGRVAKNLASGGGGKNDGT